MMVLNKSMFGIIVFSENTMKFISESNVKSQARKSCLILPMIY